MVQLTFLSGTHKGQQLRLELPVIRLGRSEDCDVRLDDQQDLTVSSHHAEIVVEDGAYVVIDTGSTNGTWVNDQRLLEPHELKVFDRIRAGLVLFVFDKEFAPPGPPKKPDTPK